MVNREQKLSGVKQNDAQQLKSLFLLTSLFLVATQLHVDGPTRKQMRKHAFITCGPQTSSLTLFPLFLLKPLSTIMTGLAAIEQSVLKDLQC